MTTQAQDNAARFATTRDVWSQQQINSALDDLDRQLAACRDLPGMLAFLDRAVAWIEHYEGGVR